MILSLFREKLDRSAETLPRFERAFERGIGQFRIEKIALPAELGRRMGVGIGNHSVMVELRHPPIHQGIGRKPRFQSANLRGQIPETFLQRVETRKGAEQGKVRRPNVRGNQQALWAGVQGNLQQIPAVQPEDGPAVGADVPDGLQLGGQQVRRLQRGEMIRLWTFRVFPSRL